MQPSARIRPPHGDRSQTRCLIAGDDHFVRGITGDPTLFLCAEPQAGTFSGPATVSRCSTGAPSSTARGRSVWWSVLVVGQRRGGDRRRRSAFDIRWKSTVRS